MQLRKVLSGLEYKLISGDLDTEITSVEFDSRKVVSGSSFVCVCGITVDGHAFACNAVVLGSTHISVSS